MSKVDLYDTSYGNNAVQAYREVRLDTYGEDFGQTSWATSKEFRQMSAALGLQGESRIVEIGCGSGGCALYFAQATGCRVEGLDVNPAGVRVGNEAAVAKGLASRVVFSEHDVSRGLPYDTGKFDAVYSNDAICHVPKRLELLRECWRILKPSGRVLFSDALVVTGALSNEEIAVRSSIGFYVFVPCGENERVIEEAGFQLLQVEDTTANAAAVAKRWHDARARRENILVPIEGRENFDGLQGFLSCVYTLAGERRLSRFLYLAGK